MARKKRTPQEEIQYHKDQLAKAEAALASKNSTASLTQTHTQMHSNNAAPASSQQVPYEEPDNQKLPAKAVAAEVIRHMNSLRILSIIGFIGIFATAIGSIVLKNMGASIAIITFSIPNGYYLFISQKEIKRLKAKFNL